MVVTWEDQQNINKFGRLNNKFHELEEEIKISRVFLFLFSLSLSSHLRRLFERGKKN